MMDITDKKSIQWSGKCSAQFKCSCGRTVYVDTGKTVFCKCGNKFWLGTRLYVEVYHKEVS